MGLQWGHASSRVETRGLAGWCVCIPGASMGPRVFTRGNYLVEFDFRFNLRASMGPLVFTRGNVRVKLNRGQEKNASMGPRVFTRGNSGLWRYESGEINALQWGHASSRVETSTVPKRAFGMMKH